MFQKIIEHLKLEKPLIIFDIETTGLSIKNDKIIELAYLKIWPDGKNEQDDLFFNPSIKIAQEVTAIHGITNADLENAPFFYEQAQNIFNIFNNCYYGGFNIIDFDLPFLKNEFLRNGIDFKFEVEQIIDSRIIFNRLEARNLSAAYKFYCGKEHTDAHKASADVAVTAEVLLGQLEKYPEIHNLNFLNKIHQNTDDRFVDRNRRFYWRDGEAYFAFSKHKDEPLARVAQTEPGFLQWILNSDFADETKDIIQRALFGEFPKKTYPTENT